MSHAIKAAAVDQIAFFRAYDTDGTAKVNLTSATAGLALSVFRIGASAVSISSLSDKAADNTAHADGAIRQIQGNLYTVDLPDAAQATQVASICVKGTYTGGVIEGVPHPIVGYDGTATAVGANTTAPDNATITLIQAKTTNLPSDPADQSLIIAATDAVMTRLGAPVGASVSADVAAVQSGVTTLLSRVTSTVAQLWADLVAMITGSGTAGAKFTTTALENGPSGGDAEQATLEDVQTTVDAIALRVAGNPIQTVSRVASGGAITAYVGDDFRVRSGTELEISVSDVAGTLYDKFTAIGEDNLVFGASRPGKPGGAITGTIAELAQSGSGASQLLLITVEIEECGTGLTPSDDYTYQIEQLQTQGDEIDSLVEIEGTLDLRRRVTA